MNRHPVPPASSCASVREAVSAELDGETHPLDRATLRRHLAACEDCASFAERLPALGGAATRDEQPVPDLTERVLAARAARQPAPRSGDTDRVLRPARGLVALAGAVQLVLSVPALLGLLAADVHVGRDLGALQLALGVGLLLAALQPFRAAGVLPVAVAVTAATLVTVTVDVSSGAASVVGELTHLSEFVGVVALWVLTRHARTARPTGGLSAEAV